MANKEQETQNKEVKKMFNIQCSIINFQIKGKRDVLGIHLCNTVFKAGAEPGPKFKFPLHI